MDFLELAKQRCTTRGFTDKKIDKDELDRILFAGRVAPTACNKQPQRNPLIRPFDEKCSGDLDIGII